MRSKLIRDLVPIRSEDAHLVSLATGDEKFRAHLAVKLTEEVSELLSAQSKTEFIEELADIAEVLEEMMRQSDVYPEQVRIAKAKKYSERGGFQLRRILKIEDRY